ncbi:hypothetical protein [Lyngbya aestuarii]|uniref:hypothetical protein n=1 Tax=Lyngbya aestuarii TaxID=118322 RepID=UPI00403DF0E7
MGLNFLCLPADASSLFVGSFNNDSVLRYDAETGELIDTFVTPGAGGLEGPVALTFGQDNNFYVVSILNNSVLLYDGQTGAFLDPFVTTGSGGLASPQDLTFGLDNNLYVSSTNPSC